MKVYLQRLNPATDLISYYSIQIQPDLWGRWHVIREWGRAGSPGTLRKTPHDELQDAMDALQMLRDRLTREGYLVVMQEGVKASMAPFINPQEKKPDEPDS
ncbi:MAG: WGR domain-containing protein [Magnetococcales bacterium]|nr:WGR domain-containing protein [Magnetococcales bacterium]MBF0321562.1 WGR domain-containing protein [Magnetococcales bacterium]